LVVFLSHPRRPDGRIATSLEKASSIPGIRHTATLRSSTPTKPRVPVPKSCVKIPSWPTHTSQRKRPSAKDFCREEIDKSDRIQNPRSWLHSQTIIAMRCLGECQCLSAPQDLFGYPHWADTPAAGHFCYEPREGSRAQRSAKPGNERVLNFCQVRHRLRGSTSARIANQTNSEVLRGTACGNSRSLLRDAQTLLPIL
jgi:hypothetical protein